MKNQDKGREDNQLEDKNPNHLFSESTKIKKRLVLSFPGFEKITPTHQFFRMKSGLKRFSKVWNIECKIAPINHHPNEHFSHTSVITYHNNNITRTRFVHCLWHDIIDNYSHDMHIINFFKNLSSYFTFFYFGTIFSYFKSHWRYGVFSVYPLLFIILALTTAYLTAELVSDIFFF